MESDAGAERKGNSRPTNDNRRSDGDGDADVAPWRQRIDKTVLSVSRLIGQPIARAHFEASQANNDNTSQSDERALPEPESKGREGRGTEPE